MSMFLELLLYLAVPARAADGAGRAAKRRRGTNIEYEQEHEMEPVRGQASTQAW